VIGNAVKVLRIATGEVEDDTDDGKAAQERWRKGGKSRSSKLTAEERADIA
jgi:hypothetical protein